MPPFLQDYLLQREAALASKASPRQTMTCSVSELLSSQDLNEVFASFKEHELEFESYLRPIMQDVIKESDESAA